MRSSARVLRHQQLSLHERQSSRDGRPSEEEARRTDLHDGRNGDGMHAIAARLLRLPQLTAATRRVRRRQRRVRQMAVRAKGHACSSPPRTPPPMRTAAPAGHATPPRGCREPRNRSRSGSPPAECSLAPVQREVAAPRVTRCVPARATPCAAPALAHVDLRAGRPTPGTRADAVLLPPRRRHPQTLVRAAAARAVKHAAPDLPSTEMQWSSGVLVAGARAEHWTRRLAASDATPPADAEARKRWPEAYAPASAADGGRVRAYGTSSGSKLLTYVR
jgi:hypothetical protein